MHAARVEEERKERRKGRVPPQMEDWVAVGTFLPNLSELTNATAPSRNLN